MSKEWGTHNGYYWLKKDVLRKVLTLEEQGCYFAMFSQAIAARNEGRIEVAVGIPYSREHVARYLEVPLAVFNSTLDKCISLGRIVLNSDVPCFVNWSATRPTRPPLSEDETTHIRRGRMSKDIRKDLEYAEEIVSDCRSTEAVPSDIVSILLEEAQK